jgi:hypothetical protein
MKTSLNLLLALCFISGSARAFSVSDKSSSLSTRIDTDHLSSRRDALQKVGFASLIASAPSMLVLPANADDDKGYITTSRGIKYKVTQPPTDVTSPTPQRAQNVKAKYTLYLNSFPEDDFTAVKIDSSNKGFMGEKPFGFMAGIGQVIKGWDLMIMEMRVGEVRKLVIPADLGYGEKGAGGKIPGRATLYFDVELAEIGDMPELGEKQYKWLEENPL